MHASFEWIDSLVAQPIATPAYVFSAEAMNGNMRKLSAALGTPIIFSVSACPSGDILMRGAEDVRFGVRCASKTEMGMVVGWRTDYAFVTLPSMDEQAMRAVLGAKFRMIVDSSHQIEMLASLRGKREVAPLSLRVSAGLIDGAGDGSTSRFGMDWEDLELAIALARRHNVAVGGLYVFGGTNSFEQRGLATLRAMREMVPRVEAELGAALRDVVIGAGLRADWDDDDTAFAAYRSEVGRFPAHIQMIHDVGRGVIASAGCFVTKVVARKKLNGRAFAICDGGMAQAFLLSKAAQGKRVRSHPLLSRAGQALKPVDAGRRPDATRVVGSSPSEDDVLAETDTVLEPGDLLVFPGAGAYCRTTTPLELLGQGAASAYVV